MSRNFLFVALVVALVGCGTTSALPTSTAATNPSTVAHSSPLPRRTAPTVTVSPAFMGFIHSLCHSMSRGDAGSLAGHLMHYQYNSGLRWGMYGDGEGTTSDPGTLSTWLSGSHVHCLSFSPNVAGHGTLLTAGWARPGASALLDLDLLNGQWVINDFTFSSGPVLARAMHAVAHPVLTYRG